MTKTITEKRWACFADGGIIVPHPAIRTEEQVRAMFPAADFVVEVTLTYPAPRKAR